MNDDMPSRRSEGTSDGRPDPLGSARHEHRGSLCHVDFEQA